MKRIVPLLTLVLSIACGPPAPPVAAAPPALNVRWDEVVFAGKPASFTLFVVDPAGDVVEDYVGTVHFEGWTASKVPPDYAFTLADHGQHTFTDAVVFDLPGTGTLNVNDAARPEIRGSSARDVLEHGVATE